MVQRPKSSVTIVVVLLPPVVLVALYVVGYFALADVDQSLSVMTVRTYRTSLIKNLYYPLAVVEAKATGHDVLITDGELGTNWFWVQP